LASMAVNINIHIRGGDAADVVDVADAATNAATKRRPFGMAILPRVKGRIELQNVSFSYPSRARMRVLQNKSLLFKARHKYALCGPSGCGKSTVLQLIMRLYDVPLANAGRVLLDGRDIRELCPRWMRTQIAIVTQQPVLFTGTVFENIVYGHTFKQHDRSSSSQPGMPAASQGVTSGDKRARHLDAVVAAAKVANAHNFINKLPKGYSTMVSTALLSGGQLQRLAIARAVLRGAPILLLDEVTSALDPRSAAQVNTALLAVSRDKTVIYVTHDRDPLPGFERINLPPPPPSARAISHERSERGGAFAS